MCQWCSDICSVGGHPACPTQASAGSRRLANCPQRSIPRPNCMRTGRVERERQRGRCTPGSSSNGNWFRSVPADMQRLSSSIGDTECLVCVRVGGGGQGVYVSQVVERLYGREKSSSTRGGRKTEEGCKNTIISSRDTWLPPPLHSITVSPVNGVQGAEGGVADAPSAAPR